MKTDTVTDIGSDRETMKTEPEADRRETEAVTDTVTDTGSVRDN